MILLFDFMIIHTPASKHTDSDELSRRRHADSNLQTDKTYDKWIDEQYEFIANLNTKGESKPLLWSERGIAVDKSQFVAKLHIPEEWRWGIQKITHKLLVNDERHDEGTIKKDVTKNIDRVKKDEG